MEKYYISVCWDLKLRKKYFVASQWEGEFQFSVVLNAWNRQAALVNNDERFIYTYYEVSHAEYVHFLEYNGKSFEKEF